MTALYDLLIREIDKKTYAETDLNVKCWIHQLCLIIENKYQLKKEAVSDCECLTYLKTLTKYLLGPYCCKCGRKL